MAVRPTKARFGLNQMWKRATGNTYQERKARKNSVAARINKRFPPAKYERYKSPYSNDPTMGVRSRALSRAGTHGLSRGAIFSRLTGHSSVKDRRLMYARNR